jgi:hypothetical protein
MQTPQRLKIDGERRTDGLLPVAIAHERQSERLSPSIGCGNDSSETDRSDFTLSLLIICAPNLQFPWLSSYQLLLRFSSSPRRFPSHPPFRATTPPCETASDIPIIAPQERIKSATCSVIWRVRVALTVQFQL